MSNVVDIRRGRRWGKLLRAIGVDTLDEARAELEYAEKRAFAIRRIVRELEQIDCPHADVKPATIDRPGECRHCGKPVAPTRAANWRRCTKRRDPAPPCRVTCPDGRQVWQPQDTGPRCTRRKGHDGECTWAKPRRRAS